MTERDMASPYAHWMLREIYEQPATLAATLAQYVDKRGFREDACAPIRSWLKQTPAGMVIAASGSSRHAGLLAKHLFKSLSGTPVEVEYASEYGYVPSRKQDREGLIVISQSGETADTLAALRKAEAAGLSSLAITNVDDSTMSREATVDFPTQAGRERAIPATKSFTAQLLNVYLLALLDASVRDTVSAEELQQRLAELRELPGRIEEQLKGWNQAARGVAEASRTATNFLFLGRGIHYPIAAEGALKLKESAYVHAEGYPSGELKHGPNALVSKGTPLLMLATVDRMDGDSVLRYEKVLHLMRDMHRQGAEMIAVANQGDQHVAALANHVITVEESREVLMVISEVIPLQLLAYQVAVGLGIDVDNPRNLSKAVLSE